MAWQPITTTENNTPQTPPQSSGGGWQTIGAKSNAPSTQSGTPSPNPPAPVASNTTPATVGGMAGSLGGGYGTSNITDPASNKPLLTYENQGAQSSQLLSDRTAPTFDPTVPQKIDPKVLQDPRMAESTSQTIKQSIGGNNYQELDHIMPLELGGSNNKSNLRLEGGQDSTQPYGAGNPTPTDPLENSLKDQVTSGKISLVDGWKLMAQAKGLTLPEQGGKVPQVNQTQSTQDNIPSFKDNAGRVITKFFPGVLKTLSELQLDPLNLKASPLNYFKDYAKSIAQTVISEGENIKQAFTGSTPSAKVGGAMSSVAGGAGVLFSPVTAFFSAVQDVPVLGSVAKLLTLPLSGLSEGGAVEGKAIADKLPLPQESKDNIANGLGQILGLANMFAAGDITEAMAKDKLTPEFSPKDAETIIAKARDMEAGKDIVPETKLSDIAESKPVAPKDEITQPKGSGTPAPKMLVENGKDVNNEIAQSSKPIEYEKQQGTTINVNGKTYQLTGAAEQRYLDEKSRSDSYSKNTLNLNEQEIGARQKGEGMKMAALKRELTGEYTTKELRDKINQEKSNYKGKTVSVEIGDNGEKINGTIKSAPSFGRYKVELDDGTTVSVLADKITDTRTPEEIASKIKDREDAKPYIPKPKSVQSEIIKSSNPEPKTLIDNEIGQTPKSRPTGALRPIEGTGEMKTRGLSEGVISKAASNTPSRLPSFAPDEARSLEQAQVASKLTDIFGDLPQYKTMDVADQGAKATDLFEKDPESAKQIAYGAKTPPKGLTPEAVFVVVEQDAIERGDTQTLKELANSRLTQEATTMGQRIRMLGERNPEAPTDAIRAIQESRVEKAKAQIDTEVQKAQPMVKEYIEKASRSPQKITLDSFIESITC